MQLIQIIYKSIATDQFSESQLVSILTSSAKNNEINQITGMLLYQEGRFIQVLEGGSSTIHELMTQIKVDPRNESVNALQIQSINSRDFPSWSMGFPVAGDSDLLSHPHFVDFFSASFDSYKAKIRYGTALIELLAFANKLKL